MALIKSHSNYVLKSKHQTVSDGTIWERDITTIGGVNQFSPGQVPIYRSNNFIISVRNDGRIRNQFNKPKWYENSEGTIWTLENVDEMVSPFEDENDVKIVLKQDYYDFNDFAYYGSLSEMFRAAIIDLAQRFPGELYLSKDNPNAYYTSGTTKEIGEYYDDVEKTLLGNENLKYVFNPYGINIHSISMPKDGDFLKYFAEEGYKNYEIIENDDEENPIEITSWDVDYYYFEYDKKTKQYINYSATTKDTSETKVTSETSGTPYPCKGEKAAVITIGTTDGNVEIEAWLGDELCYLYSGNTTIHIRPTEKYISKFYNECDNFEKIILNRKTTPKYKAIFSVIKENDYGYYREMEEFVFPTAEGGYNLDISEYGFNTYTTRLAEIGAYYDEYFTDNLYRSMTHEAIKNFDWTFTREFYEGDEQEYVFGGEKIQKTLRLFAREFDEIKSYIDNIANSNNISYDERNNLPDYFLTDTVTDSGWDVKLVIPYGLKEVFLNDRSENTTYTLKSQLENSVGSRYFMRQFSQTSDEKVIPYSKENLPSSVKDGYFVLTCDGDTSFVQDVSCGYVGSQYKFLKASGSTYYDGTAKESDEEEECGCKLDNRLKYRVKSFTDERQYSYLEANNEFLRRLKINSPYIWRNKGTVEGIEMILGMFGLKSKRWVEANNNCKYKNNKNAYDYEIVEYSSFTNRIEEQWDASHQMYRIDWLNSTKTITYDYRTVSKYNTNGADRLNYLTYQGIPVAYRDEYEYSDKFVSSATNYSPYIKVQALDYSWTGTIQTTSSSTEAFKEISRNNAPVKRRYLYPQFNKDEQLDGNPYFQMDGGWLSKSIGSDKNIYNFQFDLDDNVVFTNRIDSGYTDENNTIIDNRPLFKETIRNIRLVDNIKELLAIPKNELYNGVIVYVAKIEKDIAVIGNTVYDIKYEYNETNENEPLKYIELVKSDGFIRATYGMYFDKNIIVYDRNGHEVERDVANMKDGMVLKAYIFENQSPQFVCKSSESNYVTNSFNMVTSEDDDTNYFLLENVDFSDTLINKKNESWTYGWKRLKNYDCDYLKVNTIENYYKGNNPHNGKMIYDSGHEYFTYFNRIFKHAHDNRLFDERCFNDVSYTNEYTGEEYSDYLVEINSCGFNGLIDKNELIKHYTPFLISGDTKIRYFGNYKTRKGSVGTDANEIGKIYIYGENQEKIYNDEIRYINDYSEYSGSVISYTLKDYAVGFSDKTIKLDHVFDETKKKWIPKEAVTSETPSTTLTIPSGTSTNPIIDIQTDKKFKLWNDELVTAEVINKDIIDESTNQIMNNKRLSIIFNLKSKNWYSNSGQTEVKYLDNIVMNYLTQMLPSTVIVDIYYKDNEQSNKQEKQVEEWECVTPD